MVCVLIVKNEVTTTQVSVAMRAKREKNTANILYTIAVILKEAYKQGKIKI